MAMMDHGRPRPPRAARARRRPAAVRRRPGVVRAAGLARGGDPTRWRSPRLRATVLIGTTGCRGAFAESLVREVAAARASAHHAAPVQPGERAEAKPRTSSSWTEVAPSSRPAVPAGTSSSTGRGAHRPGQQRVHLPGRRARGDRGRGPRDHRRDFLVAARELAARSRLTGWRAARSTRRWPTFGGSPAHRGGGRAPSPRTRLRPAVSRRGDRTGGRPRHVVARLPIAYLLPAFKARSSPSRHGAAHSPSTKGKVSSMLTVTSCPHPFGGHGHAETPRSRRSRASSSTGGSAACRWWTTPGSGPGHRLRGRPAREGAGRRRDSPPAARPAPSVSPTESREQSVKLGALTAAEAMTSPAVTIAPGRPIDEAAAVMTTRHMNRLPVIDGENARRDCQSGGPRPCLRSLGQRARGDDPRRRDPQDPLAGPVALFYGDREGRRRGHLQARLTGGRPPRSWSRRCGRCRGSSTFNPRSGGPVDDAHIQMRPAANDPVFPFGAR